ncbi:MAG: hypothetical protein IH827_03820 [Myxococcales bacterium]|nr:hypothetical protein [Myxococcales bacterium]
MTSEELRQVAALAITVGAGLLYLAVPQTALIHGDALDASIAAASIVAKVYRDAWMCRLDERHPGYGFSHHMGYGTPEHLAALDRLGPCPAHRQSFAPVSRALVR